MLIAPLNAIKRSIPLSLLHVPALSHDGFFIIFPLLVCILPQRHAVWPDEWWNVILG